jgi:hypothetical protein
MKHISNNFRLSKYDIDVRLVGEEDAEFIVGIRTDPKLGRYISDTHKDICAQIEWIRQYKQREARGEDYYFIYSINGELMGVNRLYSITENEFTGGSFVFKKGCAFEIPVLATLIQLDLGFNVLEKQLAHGDIRLNNHQVIKFHRILNVEFTTTDELNQYYVYTRDEFNRRKPIIESMLTQ